MTPERLAEIRARAEAATDGPWEAQDYSADPGDEGSCITAGEPGTMRQRAVAYAIDYPWTTPESCAADATFIAAARTDVPELVAEVRVLTTAVNALGHAHDARLAETQRLTNDLAVTEAQAIDRDEAATILAQQVEKVRALHQPWDDGPQPYCTHDREPWPCPTEQALGAR